MATSSVSGASGSQQQLDYLNLMITQLRNQDPLAPMDNAQMAQQLASLSQLQLTEKMNTSFSGVLATTQMNYAESLIGKNVTFLLDGAKTNTTARVTGVDSSTGTIMLKTASGNVPAEAVFGIAQ
jgi:flagellar basal-body rod modification protein FlgD